MTTQKGEREEALDLAQRAIDTWGDGNPPIVQLARALLSAVKAEGEMRGALIEARRYLDAVVANSGSSKRRENYAGAVRRIDAALSPKEVGK
jgi:hypothetical protein